MIMGKYNFDEIINRYNTNSLKWDYAKKRNKPDDVLPLWVADMDFKCPNEVIDALVFKAKEGIFGYSEPLDNYFDSLSNWYKNHYDWVPNTKKILLVPGVVFGIANIVKALTSQGDSIIINQPVYYPFSEAILDNKRNLIISNLVYENDRYKIDFNDFEEKIKNNNVKLYLLCNPHNPVGRVWTYDELKRINEICIKYNVIVVSDEIHADFIYKGYKFTSYANINLDNAIICNAPSKTFNLAGLHNGNIYIENNELRRRVRKEINSNGYSQSNIMGIVACEAAYRYGDEWLKELLEYLEGNLLFVKNYLKDKLPNVKLIEPEGTYLIWLDFSKLNISDDELNNIILYKAKLWLDAGNIFGEVGKNFERINIATTRRTLELALDRLYNALKIGGFINENNQI